MSLAFVFPGQGSQFVGMLAELNEKYSTVKTTFEEASEVLGYDLWNLCFNDNESQLSQTEFTQPALLTAGVAVWRTWQELGGDKPNVMAGHSLGEYTALTCAGALVFTDAVQLVQDRGRYMQSAVPVGVGGMAAIIGLDDQKVIDICQDYTQSAVDGESIQAVNFNAPGQIVIAGTKQAIADSVDIFKEAGAKRALPLPISIPAHSKLMTPASEQLAERIAGVEIKMPDIAVVHNCNAAASQSPGEVRANLVTQLDSPVLWVKSIQAIATDYKVSKIIESGPGKVLCGLIKRISKDIETAALDKPEFIEQAIAK